MAQQTKKPGWRVFLSPSWIFTAIFVIAFSYVAFTVLSPWQLHKDRDIKERNERITESFEIDPVDYSEIMDSDGALRNDDDEWRRVTLEGHYVPDSEVLLRMRSVNDTPNYQSLVGFATDAGDFLLVHRGYVPTVAGEMPEIPEVPTGEYTITGVVRHTEGRPESAPMEADGYQQVYGINTEQIGELTGLDLAVDYIQLLEDQPGVLAPMPIPKLDRGNHLSYGLQWIAFGIMAPLGLAYFVWSEVRERRRVAAEEAAMAGAAPPTDAALADAGDTETAPADVVPARATDAPPETTEDAGDTADPPAPDAAATNTAATPPTQRRSRYGTTHQNRWAKKHDRRDNF